MVLRVCHHITVTQEVGRKVTTVSEVHIAVGPVSIRVSNCYLRSCHRQRWRLLWGPGEVSGLIGKSGYA